MDQSVARRTEDVSLRRGWKKQRGNTEKGKIGESVMYGKVRRRSIEKGTKMKSHERKGTKGTKGKKYELEFKMKKKRILLMETKK